MNYFNRAGNFTSNTINFTRKVHRSSVTWSNSSSPLTYVNFDFTTLGVEEVKKHLKVDFAN